MVAAYAPESFDVKWKVQLPPDPFAAAETAPEFVGVADDRIAVAYTMREGAPHVACLALTDGMRLWDSAVSAQTTHVLTGVAISNSRVFVSMWGRLDAFDRATGKRVYSIGGW
jgi:hypothetical protein